MRDEADRKVERPVTRDEFEAVVSAVRQAITSGQPNQRIPFAETELCLGGTGEGGYTLSSPDSASQMSLFPAPATKPTTYPVQLPFVAEEFVTTEETGGQLTALWWAPPDSDRVLRELHAQSTGNGWTLENEISMPHGSGAQRVYRKGDLHRLVLSVDGAITLVDRDGTHQTLEGGQCRR